MRIRAAIATVAGTWLAAPQAFADEGFARRHEELLRHKDLQFSFDSIEPPQPPPEWLRALSKFLDAVAPAFGWLLWIVLGLAAAGLVWFIGRELWAARWGKKVKADAVAPIQAAEVLAPERARALLSEADRLAAQGEYELAARTLLHRSIDDLHDRKPNSVLRSFTAREIEAWPGLPGKLRAAFTQIARTVERSWFGGAKLQAADWALCRAAYEPFALPDAWT